MRIPFAEVQTDSPGQVVAPPQLDVRRLGEMAAAGGGAMAHLVGPDIAEAGKVAYQIDQARQATEVSNRTTEAAGELAQARIDLEKDPDVQGRLGKFQAKAEEIRQRHAGEFIGPAASDFQARFNQLYKPQEIDVRQDVRRQEVQGFKVDLSNNLEKLANQAVFAKSPLERTTYQAEADKAITQAVNNGYLNASDAKALTKAYLGKVDAALAAEQVRLNPANAIAQLGDPNMYPNLDAGQRVQLRAHAQQRAESLSAQDRAELRYDAQDFGNSLHNSIASGDPLPSETEYKAILARAQRSNPALAVRLQHDWLFATTVQAGTAGKSIPEIQAEANRLKTGVPSAPGAIQSVVDTLSPDIQKRITSRDRTPEINKAFRGAPDSTHLRPGSAVDIGTAGMSDADKEALARTLLANPAVAGIGFEGDHIHVDTGHATRTTWGAPPPALQGDVQTWKQGGPTGNLDKLHGFMEQDIPRAPTADDLRLAHTLSAIATRKIAEAARDPQLHADSERFVATLGRVSHGSPMPDEDEFKRLVDRAGGADTPVGFALTRAWTLAKTVEQGLSKTPEQLRHDAEEMSRPGASAQQLEQAHQLSILAQVKEEQRTRDPALHADLEQFGRVLQEVPGGGPLPTGEQFKSLLDRAGGIESAQGYALNRAYTMASTLSQDLTSKSVPELTTLINSLQQTNASAEDLARAHRLTVAVQAKQRALASDEAAYILKNYPTIKEQMAEAEAAGASGDAVQQARAGDLRKTGWAALLEAQRREGVAGVNMALLTKPQLAEIESRLSNDDPQVRADTMANLRETFGDFYPLVHRQLWKGKPAPPDLQVMGGLPAGEELPKQLVAEAFKIADKQADDVLGPRVKAIRDAVRQTAGDMDATLMQAPDGPAFAATYHTAIEKLAQLYAMRGEANDATAARNAANTVFYDHFAQADSVNGVSVRIPKLQGIPVVDPADVSAAQRKVLAALPNLELAIPGPGNMPGTTEAQRKTMLVNTTRSNGFWMTTADDSGMMLMTGPNGRPVRFATGEPVVIPFDSAQAMAAQNAATASETVRLLGGTRGIRPPEESFTDPSAVSLPNKLIQRYLVQPPPSSTIEMPVPTGTPTPGPVPAPSLQWGPNFPPPASIGGAKYGGATFGRSSRGAP